LQEKYAEMENDKDNKIKELRDKLANVESELAVIKE
jgi:hypothetical protein